MICSGVVRRRPIGRDDGVRALDDAGDLCRIAEVVLDCGDVLELLAPSLALRAAATTV